MSRPSGTLWRSLLALSVALLTVSPIYASTWSVCSSGCDYTSIQDAVGGAGPGDTIELGPETFHENVVINEALTIRGSGRESTVVDGNGSGTVIELDSVGIVLAHMTIQNGSNGVAGRTTRSSHNTHIDNCIIRGNTGAGVDEFGSGSMITGSLITQNAGGGVSLQSSGSGPEWTILRSVISDNTTTGGGGGVHCSVDPRAGNGGLVVIDSTLITDNSAATGGGFAGSLCAAFLINSTVSRNTAGEAGGVRTSGLTVIESTITGNEGGGIQVGRDRAVGIGRIVRGSIVANNSPVDCQGTGNLSGGYNLSSDATCGFTATGDIENTDPMLLSLADNGGTTPTRALHPNSPAIDAGGDNCQATDQRGVARPQDGDGDGVARCDMGAFEFVPLGPVDLLDALVDQVVSLDLHHGIENSLLAKLNAASLILGDLQENNDHAAADILGAFIHQVEARYGKKIAAEDADALIEAADQIIALLGGFPD